MPDNMTPEQRSRTMASIRSRDTVPELTVRRLAHSRGMRFRKHVASLPGRPDLVFAGARVVVFIDGDFWHGWRFARWRDKLAPYWRQKITRNRCRDAENFRMLRRSGWRVIHVWEHDIEADPNACLDRIQKAVRDRAGVREATEAGVRPKQTLSDQLVEGRHGSPLSGQQGP